jgi:hypothetical protein
MAISKPALFKMFLTICKNTIMTILAYNVFYELVEPMKILYLDRYYDLIKYTPPYLLAFGILLYIKSFQKRICITAAVVGLWVFHITQYGRIIYILTGKNINTNIIQSLLFPMIWALVCLYSIDIIIFMMRFLERRIRRIHQNHTPR